MQYSIQKLSDKNGHFSQDWYKLECIAAFPFDDIVMCRHSPAIGGIPFLSLSVVVRGLTFDFRDIFQLNRFFHNEQEQSLD